MNSYSTQEPIVTGTPTSECDASKCVPRYYKSRTPEEWRAYHREYYRTHAERRRDQKKGSNQRMALVRAYARYGGIVPKRVIRMLLLRKGPVTKRVKKSCT